MTGGFVPALATVVHLALAAAVSVHVLLHKRDASSATGWIGLAWLAPILGSALYFLLGINRVRRRAISLRSTRPAAPVVSVTRPERRAPNLAPLEFAGDRITQRRAEAGNRIALLHNGDGAYPAMIAAIDGAECSVALSSYIFRADAAGRGFIEALARAHRRGIEVRVLIDGWGGGYLHSSATRGLRRAGVPVARFLHSSLPWRMPFLNLRSHKKVLAVDGRVAFTGGLNIGAENLLRGNPPHPVIDTHFRVEGPVVAQLLDAFAEDWLFAAGEALAGPAWFPSLRQVGESTARVVTSGPDQDIEKIELLILEALACARSSIRIMTPYFLPDDRIITALALASWRGVEVDVVLPQESNHRLLDYASRVQIGPLLAAGCRVWTYPTTFNHSKLMTVDGLWSLVGSSNWDMRSFRLNFELDLEVYHSGMVRELDALMDAHRTDRLTAATLAARPLAAVLRDSAARLMLPYL